MYETLATTRRPVIPIVSPAMLRDDKTLDYLRMPTARDWKRVKEVLDGVYPGAWPAIARLAPPFPVFRDASYIVIDSEWVPETGHLYQVGAYAPGGDAYIWDDRLNPGLRESVMGWLRHVARRKPLVFQNAPADMPRLGLDYDACARVDDTLLMMSVLNPEMPKNLEFMTSIYGHHERTKHVGPGGHEYLRGDLVNTWSVFEALNEDLDRDPGSRHVYETYVRPLIPVVIDAHRRGVKIDEFVVSQKRYEYEEKVDDARRLAYAYCGYPILLDGPQVGTWLECVEDFGTRADVSRTPTGALALDGDSVAALRDSFLPRDEDEDLSLDNCMSRITRGAHPLLEARALHIESRQRNSLFIDKLVGRTRTYAEFLPFAQATGRWSIIRPNLAQLPADLRNLYRPDDGEAWLIHDWDGIEARIMAYLSNDPLLLEAFANGYDLHTLNVCDLFGYEYPRNRRNPHTSDLDTEWRRTHHWAGKDDPRRIFAKRFMFRLFYGGSVYNSPNIPGADALGVYGLTAPKLIAASIAWLAKHPAITTLWKEIERDVHRFSVARTPLGRRRVLLSSDTRAKVRAAYDQPMQGTVADVMNKTIIDLRRLTGPVGGHYVWSMHDSITWAVPWDYVDTFYPAYKDIVEQPYAIGDHKVSFPATYKVRWS